MVLQIQPMSRGSVFPAGVPHQSFRAANTRFTRLTCYRTPAGNTEQRENRTWETFHTTPSIFKREIMIYYCTTTRSSGKLTERLQARVTSY